jgi:S1-C subfamily serine protease
MKYTVQIITLLTFLFNAHFSSADPGPNLGSDSVVKVFVTSNSMDFYRPWQSHGTSFSTGSGCIIKGNKILTNAHVVADQTFIQIKKSGDPKRYTAKVEAIGYDCDLALLTIDDQKFFDGTKALELGPLPKLQDSVTVLGFPQGGDELSITEGVVSRIEVTAYSQSTRKLLTIQIDAAINPGNSGGPVIDNGNLVGIAMQVYQTGQNIGYMIPPPIIEHFLEDLKDKRYDGFPLMGIDFNTTENTALRQLYGIDQKDGGVLVTRVLPFSPADQTLKEGDVILTVSNVPIGEDGTFKFRDDQRLTMPYLITKEQIGSSVKMQIVRNKKVQDIDLKLTLYNPLVPYPNTIAKPTYYIYGGLVFTVLSSDLLNEWGSEWWNDAPLDFRYYLIGQGRLNKEDRKEVVVLLQVLSDDINVGYHNNGNDIVDKVNGKTFTSFREFVQLLNEVKVKTQFTVIEFENATRVVMDNNNIDNATTEIIKRNNIPQAYSDDVAEWLQQK